MQRVSSLPSGLFVLEAEQRPGHHTHTYMHMHAHTHTHSPEWVPGLPVATFSTITPMTSASQRQSAVRSAERTTTTGTEEWH